VDIHTPGAIVNGTVVDALNQPVAGAAVTVVPEAAKRGIAFRYGSATTAKYESSGTPVTAALAKPSEVSLTLIPFDNK